MLGATSTIEWTDATWNPVRGCTKITPGCDHCYAETFAERFRGVPGHPYEQGFDLRLVPEKLAEPLRWKTPKMIFVNSMSDLFHKDVPDDYVEAVCRVMERANWHTYQVLTKRSSRLRRHARRPGCRFAAEPSPHLVGRQRRGPSHGLRADRASAAGPGRGPIPVHRAAARGPGRDRPGGNPLGDRRRRERRRGQADAEGMGHVDSRSVRAASVPFFFKQWGGVRKSKAGRELDGRTHDAIPPTTQSPVPDRAMRMAAIAELERRFEPPTEGSEAVRLLNQIEVD